ncbi:hypothetical protein [Paracoccus sp. SSK6]|uniref:hypothetical protein n=1 Tax=Paracoccus sp. SSK6 TaxID=3143131 RepID=UPI00321A853A
MEQQIADLKTILRQIIRSGGLDASTINEACRVLGVPLGDPEGHDLTGAQGRALGAVLWGGDAASLSGAKAA